jgi:hypothetical protein
MLSQGLCNELQQIIDTKHYIKPAHILCSVQLVCFAWFSNQKYGQEPPTPDFVMTLQSIILHTYVLPNLPPSLCKLAYPRPSTAAGLTPTLGSVTDSTGLSSHPSSGSSSNASVILGISLPTALTDGTNQNKGAKIVYLNPVPALQMLIPTNYRLRSYMGNEAPPLLDDGTQPCLAYIWQSCWSTCHVLPAIVS